MFLLVITTFCQFSWFVKVQYAVPHILDFGEAAVVPFLLFIFSVAIGVGV